MKRREAMAWALAFGLAVLMTAAPGIAQTEPQHGPRDQDQLLPGDAGNVKQVAGGPAKIPLLPPEGVARVARTFENGTTGGLGNSCHETATGCIEVVDNPAQWGRNTSSKVARLAIWDNTSGANERAELTLGYLCNVSNYWERLPSFRRRYIYKWSYFIPANFFSDGQMQWNIVSQWKTAPCGDGNPTYAPWICFGAPTQGVSGIFNDLSARATGDFEFRLRAEPDCVQVQPPSYSTYFSTGQWVDVEYDVIWTPYSEGHVKISINGNPVFEQSNIKTLFSAQDPQGFDYTLCRVYWSIGIYTNWSSDNTLQIENPCSWVNGQKLWLYIDNLEIREMPWRVPVMVRE